MQISSRMNSPIPKAKKSMPDSSKRLWMRKCKFYIKDKNSSTLTPCLVLTFCLLLMPFQLFARVFTSTDGKKMDASIIAVQGNNVILKRGPKQYTVPVKRFTLEDQSYIKKWGKDKLENLIPRFKVEINSGKSNRSDRKDNFDNRQGSFQISVKVTNEEIHYSLKDGQASLSVIGEDCDDPKKFGIMQKASFKIKLDPGKTFTWKGPALHYKFDDHAPAYWGTKYYAYVFQIKNAVGKVIYKKSSQKKFDSYVDKILKLSVENSFDKELNPRGNIHIYKN